MHTSIRHILDTQVPNIDHARKMAEPSDVTKLRLSMSNTLRCSQNYDDHPNTPPNERTVEFTVDIITSVESTYIFDKVLWGAGWQYWERLIHPELGRTTYKLWLYPDQKLVKNFDGSL